MICKLLIPRNIILPSSLHTTLQILFSLEIWHKPLIFKVMTGFLEIQVGQETGISHLKHIYVEIKYMIFVYLSVHLQILLLVLQKLIKENRGIVPFVTMDNGSQGTFHHIFTVAFDRLFQVRLGDCTAGLEPPHRGQKQWKSYCENATKRPLRGVAKIGTIPQNIKTNT